MIAQRPHRVIEGGLTPSESEDKTLAEEEAPPEVI